MQEQKIVVGVVLLLGTYLVKLIYYLPDTLVSELIVKKNTTSKCRYLGDFVSNKTSKQFKEQKRHKNVT